MTELEKANLGKKTVYYGVCAHRVEGEALGLPSCTNILKVNLCHIIFNTDMPGSNVVESMHTLYWTQQKPSSWGKWDNKC